jgi:thiol:disulfide interchange protein DsbD
VLANGNASKHAALNFKRIQSVADLDQQVKAAQGKRVMVDFYADWCVSCKEYEQFVFSDLNVQTLLKNTVLLQADVTANNADDLALLKRFELFGPPGIIFFDAQGKEITQKIVGYKNAQQFSEFIQRLNP